VAAKTGTHQRGDTGSNSAAWTVGYTPSISTAIWVGDPANSAIKDESGGDIFGRGLPGSIWQRFMNAYLMATPLETFPAFKLIGPAAAPPVADPVTPRPAPRREPHITRPSAPPELDFKDFLPTPINPSESEKPAKPRRNKCTLLCDNHESDDEQSSRNADRGRETGVS
jgi:membrane peptidoglycan carboxypeptidase